MSIYNHLFLVPHNLHYLNRYVRLLTIWQAQVIPITEYTERHHILPRSMFAEFASFRKYPDNMIVLTARQHFVAHWILSKAFKTNGMIYAYYAMMNGSLKQRQLSYTSRQYESARMALSKSMIGNSRGIGAISEWHKQRISKALTGRIIGDETRKKLSEANKGRKHSEKSRANMSKGQRNRLPITPETCKKISESLTGVKHSEERRARNHFNTTGMVTAINIHTREYRSITKEEFSADGKKNWVGPMTKLGPLAPRS